LIQIKWPACDVAHASRLRRFYTRTGRKSEAWSLYKHREFYVGGALPSWTISSATGPCAPQRFGYNVVCLYPTTGASIVTVTFRGVNQPGADADFRALACVATRRSTRSHCI